MSKEKKRENTNSSEIGDIMTESTNIKNNKRWSSRRGAVVKKSD